MDVNSNSRHKCETRLNVHFLRNQTEPIAEPQEPLQVPPGKPPHLSAVHKPYSRAGEGPGALPGEETCFSSKYSPGKLKAPSSVNPLSFSYRSYFLFL